MFCFTDPGEGALDMTPRPPTRVAFTRFVLLALMLGLLLAIYVVLTLAEPSRLRLP